MPDLTVAELARRYRVHRSTVARAVAKAAIPPAPSPVNPGEPQLRYSAEQMDAWWPHRTAPGRPAADRGPVQ